jgi:hypothetical protein
MATSACTSPVEPTLYDEPPELRLRGERRIEMQRVLVA